MRQKISRKAFENKTPVGEKTERKMFVILLTKLVVRIFAREQVTINTYSHQNGDTELSIIFHNQKPSKWPTEIAGEAKGAESV